MSNKTHRHQHQAPEQTPAEAPVTPEPTVAIPALPDAVPPPSNAELFSVMGPLQEAINGRAAMLGFVAAVVLERISGQSVLSQLGGRVVDGEMVERALGASDMGFAFVVVVVTLATFAPLVYANERPGARSLGPFSAGLETTLGRAAQIGFAGLVLVEVLKGNTPLF